MGGQVKQLRTLLSRSDAVMAAAVSDPVSARLAEGSGFKAAALLSSSATMAVLGAPDISLISLTEMAEQTRRVARACGIPVLVDGEHGFGNALNAMRTVEEIEASGAAAVTIEDTVLPRDYRSGPGPRLIGEDEGTAKIRAALLGRRNPAFVVLARTSAFAVTSAEESLRRIRNYQSAGADGLFLSGVKTVEQLQAARRAVDIPIIVGAVAPELRSQRVLADAGVSIWIQGNLPLFDAVRAMKQAYADICSGARGAPVQGSSADPLVDEVLRGRLYEEWMNEYC